MNFAVFQNLLRSTFALFAVFIYGCIGETLTEKSGHLNLGIPGLLSLGSCGGVIGASIYMNSLADPQNPNAFLVIFIPLVFALVFGALGGLFFSFFCVTLRCNQNVTGICFTSFGVGLTGYLIADKPVAKFNYLSIAGKYFQSMFFTGNLPAAKQYGFFVDVFCTQGFLTYFAIILALILAFVLNKTKVGLHLRAVGENPAAADAVGINVNRYRYVATTIGSAIAALGGLFFIMENSVGCDPALSVEAYGWLSVALVIFSMWKPGIAIIGSFIFALFYTLPGIAVGATGAMKEFYKMIPYVMTLVILIITSILKIKGSKSPQGLGLSYFREDR